MIQPTPGFILISKLDDGFFVMPNEEAKLHRIGKVVAVGDKIIHTSGKELPCPVKVDDVVSFQYVENHDLKWEGKEYYLVQFNLITATLNYAGK